MYPVIARNDVLLIHSGGLNNSEICVPFIPDPSKFRLACRFLCENAIIPLATKASAGFAKPTAPLSRPSRRFCGCHWMDEFAAVLSCLRTRLWNLCQGMP
jgi:hypothetical protein